MADYLTTDTELTSIANAIRTKGGTSAALTYPAGFVSAINAIPSGGGGAWQDVSSHFNYYDGTCVLDISAAKNGNLVFLLVEVAEGDGFGLDGFIIPDSECAPADYFTGDDVYALSVYAYEPSYGQNGAYTAIDYAIYQTNSGGFDLAIPTPIYDIPEGYPILMVGAYRTT